MENRTDWTKRLRFRHLTVLLALHETRSLSQTAVRMSMTQPALSKWLRDLEIDLDVVLFERHSRGVIPTAQCELLVARSRLVLNELDRTAEQLRLMADGNAGKLYIGATPITVPSTLPHAVALFHAAFPSATIAIADGYLDQMLPQLREGRLDLIVSLLEDRDYGDGLAQERLYRERFVVIAGHGHPLARRRKLTWDDALSFPWAGPPPNSPMRRELENELALANRPMPRFAAQVSSNVLLTSILERTSMLSLVSEETARYFQDSGHARVIPVDIRRSSHVGFIWRKDKVFGPLEQGFLQALRTACAARTPVRARRR